MPDHPCFFFNIDGSILRLISPPVSLEQFPHEVAVHLVRDAGRDRLQRLATGSDLMWRHLRPIGHLPGVGACG